MKEFNIGTVFTDEDGTKMFHRLKDHGHAGFHAWCLKELVEPRAKQLQEVIGEHDPDYIAYMLEAIALKILAGIQAEKANVRAKETQNHRRVPSTLEALAGRKDWWKSTP